MREEQRKRAIRDNAPLRYKLKIKFIKNKNFLERLQSLNGGSKPTIIEDL